MDWSQCPDVESVPGKVSGKWVVTHTRILADALLRNVADGLTMEEISTQIYPGLDLTRAHRIVAFWEAASAGPAD